MKNLYIFLLLMVGVVGFGQTQIVQQTCFTDQFMQNLINLNPYLINRINSFNNDIKNNIINANKSSTAIITIPVFFFVLHDNQPLGVGSNISDAQVNSQLLAMNNYFLAYGLKFCLATKSGTTVINGINHINNSILADHDYLTEQQQLVNTASSLFSQNNYIRIWIVKSINGVNSGILGYSMFPNSSPIFDGIVMKYDALGDVSTFPSGAYIANYNKGKTMVHEVGHYLGLYHTFESSCAGLNTSTCAIEGDRVCDTPPVNAPNFTCINGIDTCLEIPNLPDNINNYMDYGDDNCVNEFSIGQKNRMISVLNLQRSELISVDNLIYTGTCDSVNLISATFTASKYQACTNNIISFTPLSTGASLTYLWNFGDPASGANNTSNLQNPNDIYITSNSSPYVVSLTISNITTNMSSSASIFVSNCLPILNSESIWRFGRAYQSNSLNFSSGVPVMENVYDQNYFEATACQSNNNGELLFTSHGNYISNNSGSFGINIDGSSSAHRGNLIVKDPNSTFINRYYLFVKNGVEYYQPFGFKYNLIDAISPSSISVNPSNINLPVPVPIGFGYIQAINGGVEGGEGVTAIAAQDGYWIITTGKKVSGYYFMVFKLNTYGLSFVSETQTIYPSLPSPYDVNGLHSIEVSPNGNKILLSGISHIYDFNKFTGQVIENSQINLNLDSYGASFSPDNNLLYLNSNKGYQFNLQDLNINSSKKIFYNNYSYVSGDLQRGPDNKLYYSCSQEGTKNLYVIHNPNSLITSSNPNACQFSKNGPSTGTTLSYSSIGLPNMINAKKETAFETNAISSYPISCNTRQFFPDSYGTSFNWNFGDPMSGVNNTFTGTLVNHTFTTSGTYVVTLSSSTNILIAQTTIIIGISPRVIVGSNNACSLAVNNNNNITNNSVALQQDETALWSITSGSGSISGSNNQSNVTINWSSLPSTISVTITNTSGCSFTTTKNIGVIPVITPTFDLILPVCYGATFSLPSTSSNNIVGTWLPAINTLATTTYSFTPNSGFCATTASLIVTVLPSTDPSCSSTSCQPNLTLTVPEVNTTKNYKYKNWIKTMTNYSVSSGKITNLKAEDYLLFSTNTQFYSGSTITARIENCIITSSKTSSLLVNKNDLSVNSINIEIFPNPFKNEVNIKIFGDEIKNIKIGTMEGKIIYLINNIKTDNYNFKTDTLPNGVYLLNIETINGTFLNKKIIKN